MTDRSHKAAADAGADQVQAKMDKINEKGYLGDRVDPTPLANYTVAGVTAGAPTPETDEAQADAASANRFKVERTNPAEGDK